MICIILGTRPEMIKLSPVIKALQRRKKKFFIIHTNQHYTYDMDKIFFEELQLPLPKYNINVGQRLKKKKSIISHGTQTGILLDKIEQILLKEKPEVVLLQGDTNSVLAGALAASKLNIKVGHIEAGLRSYDRTMPEEINRVLADHVSDYLFCPTQKQKKILMKEGIENRKIHITGNTIVDAVIRNSKIKKRKGEDLKKQYGLLKKGYILLTAHRQENITSLKKLKNILKAIEMVNADLKIPIAYPMHPRSEKMIKKMNLKLPKGVIKIKPVGYLQFLQMIKNSKLVITDSGGIQEECCIMKVPCVTIRENTERPETLDVKANILAGTNPKKILISVKTMLGRKKSWKNPFGDGKTGEKIVDIIFGKKN